MKVVLIYAKSQAIRQKAAQVFARRKPNQGRTRSRRDLSRRSASAFWRAELEQLGHDVRLLDDSIRELRRAARSGMEWADLVGISSLTPNARRARELGKIWRKEEYGKFVDLGWPAPDDQPRVLPGRRRRRHLRPRRR